MSYVKKKGFTLIELLIVITIVGLLSTIVISTLNSARNKAYTAKTIQEFRSLEQAMNIYLLDFSQYPPDVNRGLPTGFEVYLAGGSWPEGPYPGSVYDWDNISSENYIQMSLRFCDIDGNNCNFPTEDWAEDFDQYSSMYWCFEGDCRSHPNRPIDHPGYCVNC